MSNDIYGINPGGKVTPEMVRDALVECFYEAHCADSELGDKAVEKEYCEDIVKKAFSL